MADERQTPSPVRSWYQEHLQGRMMAIAAFLVLAGLVSAYLLGGLPEHAAGVLLASAVTVVCAAIAVSRLTRVSLVPIARFAVAGLILASACVAMIPVVEILVPGEPNAQGLLTNPGDSVALDESTHGALRVLLHGVPAGRETASVDVDLDLGSQQITANIRRSSERVRVGRRGHSTVFRDHDSDSLLVNVPAEVDGIQLAQIHGKVAGPLRLEVFRDSFPVDWELIISAVLLLALAVVVSRVGADPATVAAVAVALLFGFLVRLHATPDVAVRPEIGDLVIAVLAGSFGAGGLCWLLGKLLRPARESAMRPSA